MFALLRSTPPPPHTHTPHRERRNTAGHHRTFFLCPPAPDVMCFTKEESNECTWLDHRSPEGLSVELYALVGSDPSGRGTMVFRSGTRWPRCSCCT
jgi:hypothetical protein